MFDVLLESSARRPRRAGSTAASALMHGALMAAAVALTVPHAVDANPAKPPKPPIYIPIHPETHHDARSGRRSSGGGSQTSPKTVTIPIFTSTELPPIDLAIAQPALPEPDASANELTKRVGNLGVLPSLEYQGGVADEQMVDRVPRVLGRSPEPRYPTALREAGVQGRVVAEFVVDTLGRAEMDGLTLEPQAQPLFNEAVRGVLSRYRFTPGAIGDRKVRTRVQLPFDFTLKR
jgi:protein TonB